MPQTDKNAQFQAKLLRPRLPAGEPSWAFVVLPREASEQLPRRGRTSVDGRLNGRPFRARTTRHPAGEGVAGWSGTGTSLAFGTLG